ncbi:MAG: hypothetical protein HQL58_10815 [Magnetococcales bacterium]|nr:hypothetical protein [Magnetococcales bacterium]
MVLLPIATLAWGSLVLVITLMAYRLTGAAAGPWSLMWRLRWLFLTMVLLQGWMVPGSALLEGLPFSVEGALQGGIQAVRMSVLLMLGWLVWRMTTPLALLALVWRAGGWLGQGWQGSWQRWCAMVAFAMGCLPDLWAQAELLQQEARLRLSVVGRSSPLSGRLRLHRWLWLADVWLMRVIGQIGVLQETLPLRGFSHSLPWLPPIPHRWSGWDALLLLTPVLWFWCYWEGR